MNTISPVASMPSQRIAILDISRGVALVAMMVFHFVYDLALFQVISSGTMQTAFWQWFAKLTAGSFLFIAGISLWLAHGTVIRWWPFVKRLAIVVLAAAFVSAASYAAVPERMIYFGILHCIALSSIVGLLFLRLPILFGVAVMAFVFCIPSIWTSPAFDAPWLWWTGLSETRPPSLDYLPFFPWFAPFLSGSFCARILLKSPTIKGSEHAEADTGAGVGILVWLGRHSLLVYLLHQPTFVSLIWAAVHLFRGQ